MLNDIQYGVAYNQKTEDYQDLMLDVYLPADSDSRDKRPAVVHMHGGGFLGGDKRNDSIVKYSKMMAMRGYAVFSISYRLTGGYWSWESGKAVLDA